ncbi:MAG: CmcJ/NvfI family oxidoreductase [Pseudomonadota bacterium]
MDTYLARNASTPLGAIEAPLTYLARDFRAAGRLCRDGRRRASRRGAAATRPIMSAIRDGRPLSRRFALDQEGFELRRHDSQVGDFYDAAEVQRVYYSEVEARAARGHRRRQDRDLRSHRAEHRAGTPTGPPDPRRRRACHNDYTNESAPRRVRQLLPADEADARLARRYVEINVWRSIAGPVQSWPLALCTPRLSTGRIWWSPSGAIPSRVGETDAVRFNPQHRWFYFPQIRATRRADQMLRQRDRRQGGG